MWKANPAQKTQTVRLYVIAVSVGEGIWVDSHEEFLAQVVNEILWLKKKASGNVTREKEFPSS